MIERGVAEGDLCHVLVSRISQGWIAASLGELDPSEGVDIAAAEERGAGHGGSARGGGSAA